MGLRCFWIVTALTEDLMASLRKEGELLDADAWKYSAPRSQLHLTSMAGVHFLLWKISSDDASVIRLPENITPDGVVSRYSLDRSDYEAGF
eukprot:c26129_g1_i6 orf=158-430(+)